MLCEHRLNLIFPSEKILNKQNVIENFTSHGMEQRMEETVTSKENIDHLMNFVNQSVMFHEQQANQNGEKFNIFKILGASRKEVTTHSRFIYELINPNGAHGQGDIFLKQFLTIALGIEDEVHTCRPHREDSTEAGRRIDFTIETEKQIIGIEMKIDAGDQNEQMFDYYHELEIRNRDNRRNIKLFYLTLREKEPSKSSLNGLDKNKYKLISFEKNIIDWLNCCIKEAALKNVLREAILQYKILLESLTGKNSGVQMEIAQQLAQDQDKFKTALLIEKIALRTKVIIQDNFWKSLISKLEIQERKIVIYGGNLNISTLVNNYYTKQKNIKNFGVKIYISNYRDHDIWLYVNLYNAIHYGIRLEEDKHGKLSKDIELKKELRKSFNRGNAVADSDRDWIVSYYYDDKTATKGINFSTFNDAAISLSDETEMESAVNNIATHITELIERTHNAVNA